MVDDQNKSSPELIECALILADALRQAQIKYALIGGLAAGYRTHSRFTRDADFILTIPQIKLPAVLDDLIARGFNIDSTRTIREWTQEHMTVLWYHGIRVDWLKPVIPLYEHVLNKATEEIWLDHPIRVASADGLVLIKLLAFRTQDQLDIENLVAAHRGRLDLDWIRLEWQTVSGLDDPRMVWLMDLISRAG